MCNCLRICSTLQQVHLCQPAASLRIIIIIIITSQCKFTAEQRSFLNSPVTFLTSKFLYLIFPFTKWYFSTTFSNHWEPIKKSFPQFSKFLLCLVRLDFSCLISYNISYLSLFSDPC